VFKLREYCNSSGRWRYHLLLACGSMPASNTLAPCGGSTFDLSTLEWIETLIGAQAEIE